MPVDPRRVKELFNAALDLPQAGDRAAFFDRECAGDRELRLRLDVLMAAHDLPASELDARCRPRWKGLPPRAHLGRPPPRSRSPAMATERRAVRRPARSRLRSSAA